jgi:hypothetical protein
MATDVTTIEFNQAATIRVVPVAAIGGITGAIEAIEVDFRDQYVVIKYHDTGFSEDRVVLIPYSNIREINQTA